MTVEYTFKLRRGTAAEWTTANPVLAAGEPGVETDTDLFKFGDGATVWTGLDYANDTSGLVMSAPDILTAIKTVDGAGSGLDADLLDGSSSAAFETAGAAATAQSAAIAAAATDATTKSAAAQAAAIAAAATDATTKANTATSTAAAALSAHAAAADPHPTYLTAAEGNAAYDATGAAATATSTAASALAAHEADTTAIHGIANTANLYAAGGTDVAVADGGTGASTASGARTNLGLVIGTDVQAAGAYTPGGTDVAVTDGGTGSSTASGARTNLGLVIGTDVAAATAVARANHTGTQLASTISDLSTAAYIPGGTDVAVADGGTGSSTAAGARTSLGLVIGTNVQAQDADLDALAAISGVQGDVIYHNGTSWVRLGAGTATHVLTTGGAGANPAWAAAAGGSSDPLDANNIIAGRIFAR